MSRAGHDAGDNAPPHSAAGIKIVREKISFRLQAFPGYARGDQVYIAAPPWRIKNGFLTAVLKLPRKQIVEPFQPQIEQMCLGQ